MNIKKLIQVGIIFAVFLTLILHNMKTEVTETVEICDNEEIDNIDYKAQFERLAEVNNKMKAKLLELQKEKESNLIIKENITKKKYGYLVDLASKDFDSLNLRDKYRAGLYIMAGMAKKKYKTIPLDTLDLAVAFSKVGYLECKNRVGVSAINKHSDARGVWQWMPSYRKKHGVPEDVYDFELHEQLPYMWQYFCHKMDNQYTTPTGGRLDHSKIKSWVDVYALIFAPRFADDGLDVQFYKSCGGKCKNKKRKCAYHGNQGYDYNKDGAITKRDIRDRAEAKHFN